MKISKPDTPRLRAYVTSKELDLLIFSRTEWEKIKLITKQSQIIEIENTPLSGL